MYREWVRKAEQFLVMIVMSDAFKREWTDEERATLHKAAGILARKVETTR
jgi:hypothetical protein